MNTGLQSLNISFRATDTEERWIVEVSDGEGVTQGEGEHLAGIWDGRESQETWWPTSSWFFPF